MTLETGSKKHIEFLHQYPKLAQQSILFTEWQENALYYSLYHTDTNKVLFSGKINQLIDFFDFTTYQFEKLIEDSPLFNFSFKKHVALINIKEYTLLPSSLFNEQYQDEILKNNIELPFGKLKFLNYSLHKYQFVYTVAENFYATLEKKFIDFEIYPLLPKMFNQISNFENHYLHVSDNNLSIAFFQNDEIVYLNSFTYQSPEDLLYNVLNVLQQFDIQNNEATLILSGQIKKGDNIYSTLEKYIKRLIFLKKPTTLNFESALITPEDTDFNYLYNCIA